MTRSAAESIKGAPLDVDELAGCSVIEDGRTALLNKHAAAIYAVRSTAFDGWRILLNATRVTYGEMYLAAEQNVDVQQKARYSACRLS